MAITVDTTSVSANVSATSVTWGHTCGADTTLLVVAVQAVDSSSTDRQVDTITHGGLSLTDSGATIDETTGGFRTEIWYKINPTIGGTPNIVVTMLGKCTDLMADGISLKGTDTNTPIDSFNTVIRFGAPTVTVTTGTANTWLIDSMVDGLSSITGVSADYTEIHLTDVGADIMGSQYRDVTGAAGDYVMSWSVPSGALCCISAVAIKEAAGEPPAGTHHQIIIGDGLSWFTTEYFGCWLAAPFILFSIIEIIKHIG